MPYTWVILPIQLLHGITFGLYWTLGVQWAAACAPPGLDATLQGAFAALISLGQTIALTLGGYAFETVGGAQLYAASAVVAACAGLVAAALAACNPNGPGCCGGSCCSNAVGRRSASGGAGGGRALASGHGAWSSSVADVVLEDFDAMDEGEAEADEDAQRGAGGLGGEPTLLRQGDVRSDEA